MVPWVRPALAPVSRQGWLPGSGRRGAASRGQLRPWWAVAVSAPQVARCWAVSLEPAPPVLPGVPQLLRLAVVWVVSVLRSPRVSRVLLRLVASVRVSVLPEVSLAECLAVWVQRVPQRQQVLQRLLVSVAVSVQQVP